VSSPAACNVIRLRSKGKKNVWSWIRSPFDILLYCDLILVSWTATWCHYNLLLTPQFCALVPDYECESKRVLTADVQFVLCPVQQLVTLSDYDRRAKRMFEAELDHRLTQLWKHHERTPQRGVKLGKNISRASQEKAKEIFTIQLASGCYPKPH